MQMIPTQLLSSPAATQQTADSSSTSGSDASSNSATITANDFLQLLVTEMQNQDPTANTDPNEYIDQLVQVNSLEQLVQINQDLGGLSSTSGTGSSTQLTGATAQTASIPGLAPGNLSPPAPSTSASHVADALATATHTLAPGASSSPLDSILTSLRARAQQARTSTSNPAH